MSKGLVGKMKELDFPKEIMLEVTNWCNCRCFFCGSTNSKRERGYIDEKIAVRIIEEAYSYGARKISFHGMGEPFLCEKLADYVFLAKKLGYTYIYLDTNGIMAVPEVANKVLDAGLDSLKFSIHAATAETHRKIVGVDGFDKMLNNLKNIHNYIDSNKLSCKLIAYQAVSTLNQHEVESFRAMVEPLVDEVWIKPIHNGSGVKLENKAYAVEGQAMKRVLPCQELYQRMIINWKGETIACSTDWTGALVYGDAKQEDLKVLWNNEKIWLLRNKHESWHTLPGICEQCMTTI